MCGGSPVCAQSFSVCARFQVFPTSASARANPVKTIVETGTNGPRRARTGLPFESDAGNIRISFVPRFFGVPVLKMFPAPLGARASLSAQN